MMYGCTPYAEDEETTQDYGYQDWLAEYKEDETIEKEKGGDQ